MTEKKPDVSPNIDINNNYGGLLQVALHNPQVPQKLRDGVIFFRKRNTSSIRGSSLTEQERLLLRDQ